MLLSSAAASEFWSFFSGKQAKSGEKSEEFDSVQLPRVARSHWKRGEKMNFSDWNATN